MFAVQTWESVTGRIPKRQVHGNQFLYIQDFWTNGPFGDLLALSLIDAAIALTLARQGGTPWMVVAMPVGVLLTFGFFRGATKPGRKKPDAGYLKRRKRWVPTATGRVHLVYFFLQSGTALGLAPQLLLAGNLWGVSLVLGAVGGFLYLFIATPRDYKRGLLTP